MDVTWAACRPGERRPGVPIGRPIANIQVYVLDRQLRAGAGGCGGGAVPGRGGAGPGLPGAAGADGGAVRARPVRGGAGGPAVQQRATWAAGCRTGSWSSWGVLDGQVKVRGLRIEPGEIEAALAQHPGCARRRCWPGPTARAQRGWWPTWWRRGRRRRGSAELRRFLGGVLPDYAGAVGVRGSWRRCRGRPAARWTGGRCRRRGRSGRPWRGPTSPAHPAEELLADIWAEVLGVRPVGVEDNFFSLGGDSIRSLQVLDLAKHRGLGLALPQLFRHQTVAALAAEVGRAGPGPAVPAPTIPFGLISPGDRANLPADVEDAYPLAQLQAGMLFHSELATRSNMYHNTGGCCMRSARAVPGGGVPAGRAADGGPPPRVPHLLRLHQLQRAHATGPPDGQPPGGGRGPAPSPLRGARSPPRSVARE